MSDDLARAMSLGEAIRILTEVHLRDDPQVEFCVQMGAVPYAYGPVNQDDYIKAWGVLFRYTRSFHPPLERTSRDRRTEYIRERQRSGTFICPEKDRALSATELACEDCYCIADPVRPLERTEQEAIRVIQKAVTWREVVDRARVRPGTTAEIAIAEANLHDAVGYYLRALKSKPTESEVMPHERRTETSAEPLRDKSSPQGTVRDPGAGLSHPPLERTEQDDAMLAAKGEGYALGLLAGRDEVRRTEQEARDAALEEVFAQIAVEPMTHGNLLKIGGICIAAFAETVTSTEISRLLEGAKANIRALKSTPTESETR